MSNSIEPLSETRVATTRRYHAMCLVTCVYALPDMPLVISVAHHFLLIQMS